ncbi:hypothetical protein CAPTEDRAFT_50267, partial [Capitella teleta]
FYSVGENDEVTCFFCGVQIHKWEPHDEPWTEHAKWCPHCSYVRRHKGDAFVQDV